MIKRAPKHIFALTCTVLFMCVGSSWAAIQKNISETIVIPLIKTSDDLFSIGVSINDNSPVQMVVDTAASVSSLRENALPELGLVINDDAWRVHGLLSVDHAPAVSVENVSVLSMAHDGNFIVLTNNDSIHDPAAKGLIGGDFLASSADENRYMVMDFKNHRLAFTTKLENLGYTRKQNWSKISSIGQDNNLLTFVARVSGIRTQIILDTGINFGVINEVLAKKLAKRGRAPETTPYIDVNGEQKYLRHVLIGETSFANMQWDNYRTLINDAPALSALGLEDKPAMLMGLPFFKDMVIIVDRKYHRITVGQDELLKAGDDLPCTGSRLNCGSVFIPYSARR